MAKNKLGKKIKNIRKNTFPIAVGLLIALTPVLYLTLRNPNKAEAAWWDDTWIYRKRITIGNSGSAVSDERKIKIDVDTATLITAGKMQSDCDDVRFTNEIGNVLDYFIDTNEAACNTSSTDFYVKVSEVLAGNQSVYMYYGNPAADRGRQNDFFLEGDQSTLGVGLKAFWDLEEASGTRYDNAYTNDLSDNNTVTQTTGNIGNAGSFETDNSEYLNASDDASLDFAGSDDFSISGWFKHDTISTSADYMISKVDATVGNYFGDGSDGSVTINSNTNLTVPNKSGSYDGDMVVKNYSSLTIDSGYTLSTDQPGRGMLIYVSGNATINGTLSMTARGASANPTVAGASDNSAVSSTGLRLPMVKTGETDTLSAADFAGTGNTSVAAVANQPSISGNGKIYALSRTGASGGASVEGTSGNAGSAGSTGQTGGGGSGGSPNTGYGRDSGAGAAGTVFSGGSGGGAASGNDGYAGGANGGAGGNSGAASGYDASGGAGNPGGSGYSGGTSGEAGTGGLLVLVVGGDLTVGGSGSIQANGKNGGDACTVDWWCSGGGGSGGGNVLVLYAGTLTNNGSIAASGGSGGNASKDGGNGGSGSTITEQVSVVQSEDGTGYQLYMESDGDITFGIDDDATSFPEDSATTTTANYDDNAWHHFVAIKDDTTSIKLYIDGSEVASDTSISATGTLANSQSFNIGASSLDASSWDGQMDEVMIWKKAISATERSTLYNSGSGIDVNIVQTFSPTSGPTAASEEVSEGPGAHWKFDEGYGTTANDFLGNNDGTISGATWETEGCMSGNCLEFDGTDDKVTVSDTNRLDFGAGVSFTVSGWFRHGTIATNPDYIVSKAQAGTNAGYKIYMASDGDIVFEIDDDSIWGPDDSATTTTADYDDSEWHHFAAVKDADTSITLFIDGKQVAQDASISATGSLANNDNLLIGIDDDGTSNPWGGNLDEIKVYPYARSNAQIRKDYNSPGSVEGASASFGLDNVYPKEGLVGYWKLDESSGDASDSSGNGTTLSNGSVGTGGTITYTDSSGVNPVSSPAYADGYVVHTFTSSDTFTPAVSMDVEYLVIAGGGGGGGGHYAGGGGAGGYRNSVNGESTGGGGSAEDPLSVTADTGYTVTVGAGGAGGATGTKGTDGGDSVLGSITATGGGGGAQYPTDGSAGGSGGGASGYSPYVGGSAASPTQGYKGGDMNNGSGIDGAGGGGGAGGVGQDGQSDDSGGNGGDGLSSSITGAAVTRGGGGGGAGGNTAASAGGNGGSGGGGTGDDSDDSPSNTAGTANTGGGGGGGSGWVASYPGMAGGSGLVVTRYPYPVASFTDAKFSSGVELSGNTQHLSASDNSTLSLTGDLTLSAWINPDDVSGSQNIIGKWDGANESYLLALSGGELRMYVDSSSNYETTTSTPVDASMHHVVGVYDSGSQTVKLYVDGELQASSTTGTIPSSIGDDAGDFILGAEDTSGTATNFFDGHIDEARVYNRALDAREIRGMYTLDRSPIAHWKMDEGSWSGNGAVTDYTGNSNELSHKGNAAIQTLGRFGKSGTFDGAGDYLCSDANDDGTCDDDGDFDFGTQSFTVSGWFKHSTIATNPDYILAKSQAGTNGGYKIYMASDGDIVFEIDDDSTWGPDDSVTTTSADFDDGNWHHFSAVKDGTSSIKLYIDGILKASDTSIAATATLSNDDVLYIGVDDDGTSNDWDGQLDDFIVYNYARSDQQVVVDMNAGHPIVGSPIGSAIAHWKFDEGADNTCSGGTNDVCNSGSQGTTLDGTSTATRTDSGKFGKALDLDGTDDVITITNSSPIDLNEGLASGFTFSTWINADSDGEGNTGRIIEKGTSTFLRVDNELAGSLDIEAQLQLGTSDASLNLSAPITINTWNHVALSYTDDADDEITIWVNGVNKGSSTNGNGSPAAESSNLLIGGSTLVNFDGTIDEFKIYNSELTADQMLTEYNQGKSDVWGAASTASDGSTADWSAAREYCVPGDTGTCSAPVAEWTFNEGTGTSTYDTSTNSNTGTLGGGTAGYRPSWTNTTDIPNGAVGIGGKALDFDGTDDYISMGNPSTLNFNQQDFTLEAWIKTSSSASQDIIGKSDEAGGQRHYVFGINTSGQLRNEIRETGDGNVVCNFAGSAVLNDGKWHSVALIVDDTGSGTTCYMYADGVLDASGSTGYRMSSRSPTFYIGRKEDGSYFNGIIDQVLVYNSVRTPAQIAWSYNRGSPIGWWRLDECQGTTLNDVSGNGNNGTITIGGTGTNTSAGTCSSGTGTEAWNNGTTGKKNGSLDFDGTDDVVTVSNATEIDFDDALSSGVTFAGWINVDSDGENDVGEVFDKGTNTYCRTDSESGGSVDLECKIDLATTDASLNISSALTTSTWYHIAMVYEDDADDEITIYINGENRGSSSDGVGSPAGTDTNDLLIGGSSAANFDGQIDDFKIFNYAQTARQIMTSSKGGAIEFDD